MPIDILLSRLDKVKRTGDGKYLACCPSHADDDPSLAITDLPDGRILVHCFAGCSPGSIMESLDLSLSDLFPDGGIKHHMYGGTPVHRKQQIKKANGIEHEKLVLKIADGMRNRGEKLTTADLKREREAYLKTHNQRPAA